MHVLQNGETLGQKHRTKKKEKSDLKLCKENCIIWYKTKENISIYYSCIFLINAFSLMTKIRGSTQKHSTRSQFRKMHIHIYLYIYQVAVSGTWLEAVNSSESCLWRRQSILRGLCCKCTSPGTKFKWESHHPLAQEEDTFLWCCHDLYK